MSIKVPGVFENLDDMLNMPSPKVDGEPHRVTFADVAHHQFAASRTPSGLPGIPMGQPGHGCWKSKSAPGQHSLFDSRADPALIDEARQYYS